MSANENASSRQSMCIYIRYQDVNNPFHLRASLQDGGAPIPATLCPHCEMKDIIRQGQKERHKARSNHITARTATKPRGLVLLLCAIRLSAETSRLQWPPQCPSPLGSTLSWKTAQPSGHGNICPLSSTSPAEPPCTVFLVISPPAAVGEKVLPHLGHCQFTPSALGIMSHAESFPPNSSLCVP